jgi:hypothetical protein
MLHLIYINILVILMDITLLCTEYANLYEIQITFKGALYSIKLRLEFAILNDLMSIAAPTDSSRDNAYSRSERGTITLGTLNNRNQPLQGHASEPSTRNYTCSASRQHMLPFNSKKDDGYALRTTEAVEKEESDQCSGKSTESQHNLSEIDVPTAHTTVGPNSGSNQQQRAHSANSSEVEFAGAGY